MKQSTFQYRRALRIIIAAAVMIIANATAAWTQSTFSEGDGSSGNPYQIKTIADLQKLATDVNGGTTYNGKYFKVMNDIDFNDDKNLKPTAAWNVESTQNNFTPIGNNSHTFQGHFDGGGYTISGIRIYGGDDNASSNFKALFGFISNGATVTGVTLDDARITGHLYCGGIVANSTNGGVGTVCTVTNCTVTDRVAIHAKTNSSHYHGGIVGFNLGNFSITNCTSSATLTIAEDLTGCMSYGGIVGCTNYNSNKYTTTMSGNLVIGATIPEAADNYYGAICGYVKLNDCSLTDNYYARCTVAGKEDATGVGVYGYQSAGDASVRDVEGASHIYKLTLANGITATGTIAATYGGDNYYLQGTTITLSGKQTSTLPEGFIYDGYTVNSTAINRATFEMPAQDTEVYSTTKPVYKLTLAEGITATGTIAATYGDDNYYLQGTAIFLSDKQTGTPPEGCIYGDGYIVNGTAIDDEMFVMPAQDTEVFSTTIPVYKLTLADGITATGTIAATYGGYNYYLQGTTITLSGRPDAGEGYVYPYTLDGTTIYGATFEMPAQNLTVALGDKTDDWMYFYAGTYDDPFQIKTADQLDQLATRVNGGTTFSGQYFKLMNDIAYEYDSSTENNYTAIGKIVSNNDYEDMPFSGTFDGGGHTVSGIRIYKSGNKWGESYLGLFGYVIGGTVKNVTVADTRITGYSDCGGIVGYIVDGTVENCHVLNDVTIHAVVDNTTSHGGIAGGAESATISGCTSAVTLSVATGLTGCHCFGGIVGMDVQVTMSHCFAVGVSIPVIVFKDSGGGGAIIGGVGLGTFDHNYYIDCKVGEATTNIGSPWGDINDNDGAVPDISTIALYNNGKANATTIAYNSGNKQNVMLFGRTLYKDGSWNTLCLPFGIQNINDTPLAGATLMTLDNSDTSYESSTGTLTLDFDDADHIEAGKPYLVKWNTPAAYDIKNPVFTDVTFANLSIYSGTDAEKCQAFLNERAATSADGYVTFRGTFDPEAIYASPATNLYLGANNSIYYPSSADFCINAFRAYFQLNNGLTCGDPSSPKTVRAFSLGFGDGSQQTGIYEITDPTPSPIPEQNSPTRSLSPLREGRSAGWFTLDGRKLNGQPSAKGMYIHAGCKVVIK